MSQRKILWRNHRPTVDEYTCGRRPVAVLVDEKYDRIIILSVEIFLIGYIAIMPLDEKEIIDERYSHNVAVIPIAMYRQDCLILVLSANNAVIQQSSK